MRRLLLAWALGGCLWAADLPLQPLQGSPPFPPDNPPTAAKVELGRKLFFDNRLSGPNNRSCATCHRPELMYSDGLSRGWGLKEMELRRRTPMLYNVGWLNRLFHDARAASLEEQVPFPLRAELEMDLEPQQAMTRIERDEEYRQAFAEVFPGKPLTFDLVSDAISCFERTLVSYDSDLDRYLLGDNKALDGAAKRGMALFTGKFGCTNCHNGPLLSDQKMHYIGVTEMMGDVAQGSKYKTPSLRDAELRASYMHNGMFRDLSDVIAFYEAGAPGSEAPKLKITAAEKVDLIAFLKALNGRTYSVEVK